MELRSPSALTAAGWERITTGESGAVVLCSADGAHYGKFVAADHDQVLQAERDRLEWAGRHGIPTAQVLDWASDDDWACLLTTAVPGVPADRLSRPDLSRAWPAITAALRHLHDVPTDTCPFVGGLATMFATAEDVVRRGAVNPQFLPVEFRQTPPTELLESLRAQREQRDAEEARDLVVCHGDLCLPNVIVDPETHAVTGLVDLGRLGLADRYADVALLLANSRGTWTDEEQAQEADNAFADGYGVTLDPSRREFYLCLDALTWPAATEHQPD